MQTHGLLGGTSQKSQCLLSVYTSLMLRIGGERKQSNNLFNTAIQQFVVIHMF